MTQSPQAASLVPHLAKVSTQIGIDYISEKSAHGAAKPMPGGNYPLMVHTERARTKLPGEAEPIWPDPGWRMLGPAYPRDKCLHELIEEQVERTPDAVAVMYEGALLSLSRAKSAGEPAGASSNGPRCRPGDACRTFPGTIARAFGCGSRSAQVGRGERAAGP